MTTFSERIESGIRAFADREGITFDTAAERLVGYGLSAIDDHDRILESLKPRPYRVESCEAYVDDEGETALTDYVEIDASATIDGARKALCALVRADADTEAAIEAAPLGHTLAIGDDYYRIIKSS